LGEIDREARRAIHQQRQQRKRAIRARFDVRERKEVYEVEGEVPGFEQENISIEVTDEYTLKISGNTERTAGPSPTEATSSAGVSTTGTQVATMDGATVNNEQEIPRAATPSSETGSSRSYQPTVEDDFEDLGAETSSTISSTSSTSEPSAPTEPKGKGKVVEEPTNTETGLQQQPQPEPPVLQPQSNDREWLSERVHGSFERTFCFPVRIDSDNVRATLKNGILSINVPKAPAPQVRQISIQ